MHVDDLVQIIDNAFDPEELGKLVRFCPRFDFKDAGVLTDKSRPNEPVSKVDKSTRNVSTYSLLPNGPSKTEAHWHNFFKFWIGKLVKHYFTDKYKHFSIRGFYEFTLLKYEPGGHYIDHVDHAESVPRTLSIILFLNDSYTGGEIEFFKPDMSSSQVIKPQTGRLIMWPSNFVYPHKVLPVKKGTRYSLVSWAV